MKASRQRCIAVIREAKKEQEFLHFRGYQTLEEYFAAYSYLEPDVWVAVLNDLQIKLPKEFKTLCK